MANFSTLKLQIHFQPATMFIFGGELEVVSVFFRNSRFQCQYKMFRANIFKKTEKNRTSKLGIRENTSFSIYDINFDFDIGRIFGINFKGIGCMMDRWMT